LDLHKIDETHDGIDARLATKTMIDCSSKGDIIMLQSESNSTELLIDMAVESKLDGNKPP
jgi:hypothetical protein